MGQRSHIWSQIHADVIGQPITTPSCNHAGVLGAGVLAASGVGLYGDIETTVRDVARSGMTYDPGSAMCHYEELTGTMSVYGRTWSLAVPINRRGKTVPTGHSG